MIHLSTSLKYYKREDVQQAIVEHSRDKEVAARFNEQFGKRPDIITYPSDVLELAKHGATSFHCSEELWANPLLLQPQMQKKELDKMRKGWDLILDVDCAIVDYSAIAAALIVQELKMHGAQGVTIKFSGNKGFHIALPNESFPKMMPDGREFKDLFPEAPKKIALYVKERIKEKLGDAILKKENNSFNKVAIKTGKKASELAQRRENTRVTATENPFLNVESFLAIDTLLISSRHMYRMPYSLHEKSGLVSVPVNPEKILEFLKIEAEPMTVVVGKHEFMNRNVNRGEATKLLVEALDFATAHRTIEEKHFEKKPAGYYEGEEETLGKIPQQYFPPCIRKLLEGVEDGRKRALFVLINFLGSCNYGNEEIEAAIKKWNQKNKEPLPQLYLQSQLSYARQKAEKVLPPNCGNISYYKELGIGCTPECGNCKNPVAEAKQIYRRAMKTATVLKQPKKKAQKKDSNL